MYSNFCKVFKYRCMYCVDANNKIFTLLVFLSKLNNIKSVTRGILKKYLDDERYSSLFLQSLDLVPNKKVDQWLGTYKWNLFDGITALVGISKDTCLTCSCCLYLYCFNHFL